LLVIFVDSSCVEIDMFLCCGVWLGCLD